MEGKRALDGGPCVYTAVVFWGEISFGERLEAECTKSCKLVSVKYLCFLISLQHDRLSYRKKKLLDRAKTRIKIHFYCVDLSFSYFHHRKLGDIDTRFRPYQIWSPGIAHIDSRHAMQKCTKPSASVTAMFSKCLVSHKLVTLHDSAAKAAGAVNLLWARPKNEWLSPETVINNSLWAWLEVEMRRRRGECMECKTNSRELCASQRQSGSIFVSLFSVVNLFKLSCDRF